MPKYSRLPIQEIINDYRNTPATSRSLAAKHQASINTIQEILRDNLEPEEIQELRLNKQSKTISQTLRNKKYLGERIGRPG